MKEDEAPALEWWGGPSHFFLLPSNFSSCPKGQVVFVPGDGVLGFQMAYFWDETMGWLDWVFSLLTSYFSLLTFQKEAYHGCDDT